MRITLPEVKDLRLCSVDGRVDGNRLRRFLIRVASYRSRLVLPDDDEDFTWRDTLGLDYDGNPRLTSWASCLRRMHYVLALPEHVFKKTSEKFKMRIEALDKARRNRADVIAYSVMVVQFSVEFSRRVLASHARGCDILKQLRAEGLEAWDTQYQYGGVQESCGIVPKYTPKHSSVICGSSKAEIQTTMRELTGAGNFYT